MREKKSDKNQSELLAAAEAILFTMGKSVELSKMAEALGLSEAQTKALIEKLKEEFLNGCDRKIDNSGDIDNTFRQIKEIFDTYFLEDRNG